MNNVTLMGRTTADIELKSTTSGVSVISFSIAVDRSYTPKGQERQTDFINCVAWRNTAEFISKWFRKGDMIAITGEIQTRRYTDKDGNNRTATEVLIDHAYFCGKKASEQAAGSSSNGSFEDFEEIEFENDTLPF